MMKAHEKTMMISDKALLFVLFLCLLGCTGNHTPKPRGYFKIDLPEKKYQMFSSPTCPFDFEYPQYAKIVYDSSFFDSLPEHRCWFNIEFGDMNGKIHFSYKEINEQTTLPMLIEDSYRLTSKHIVKAESIEENVIRTPQKVYGLMYEVGGDAASAIQYYLTDSTHHFIRGSLYFYCSPNIDSMKPVIEFVKVDILHMISTFRWDSNYVLK